MELALVDYSMLKYSPALLATGAIYAANAAVGARDNLPYALERHSGFSESEILTCAQVRRRL